jgi:hypothetical protein
MLAILAVSNGKVIDHACQLISRALHACLTIARQFVKLVWSRKNRVSSMQASSASGILNTIVLGWKWNINMPMPAIGDEAKPFGETQANLGAQ